MSHGGLTSLYRELWGVFMSHIVADTEEPRTSSVDWLTCFNMVF